MNPTMARFDAMTVKDLRSIVRQIGIKGLSTARKATLVNALTVWVEGCHTDALIADSMYGPTRKMVAALDTLAAVSVEIEAHRMNDEFNAMPRKTYGDVHNASVKLMQMEGKDYAILAPSARCDLSDRVRRIWDGAKKEQAYGEWRVSQISQRPSKKAFIIVKDGVHTWVEAIEAENKIARIDAHKYFDAIHGWVLIMGEVLGRVDQDSMDVIHAVALMDDQERASENIDSFLMELNNSLISFLARADKAEDDAYATDLLERDDVAEQWTTIVKDLNKAVHNVGWSMDYRNIHTCSYQREVGMSGCAYGCKIYRCETCGDDKVIHNATYGCRTVESNA